MRLATVLLSVALPVACSSSNRTTDAQIAGQTTSSGGAISTAGSIGGNPGIGGANQVTAGAGGSSAASGGTSTWCIVGCESGPSGGTSVSGGTSADTGTAGAAGAPQNGDLARSSQPFDTNPSVSDADYATFIASINDFGFDLFRLIAPAETNWMMSPVSMAFALAVTYAGARGNTATQMETVMHITLPQTTYHAGYNRLSLDLASRNIDPHQTGVGEMSLKLLPVNAAWSQKDYTLESAYLDTLSTNYDAGLHLLDFIGNPDGSRTTINQWVSDQTANKIVDLLSPGSIDPTTRLVLTNALYFYGSWSEPFIATLTSDGTFTTLAGGDVTVPMLHGPHNFVPRFQGTNYEMADLIYDGAKVVMTILVPAAGQFEAVRGALTHAWLEQARATPAAAGTVAVTVPKFRFTWGTKTFKDSLQSLGMTDAFIYGTADFSGMEPTRQLFLGNVYHKTFVGVDENGTEAAAATAGTMIGNGTTPLPQFVVDRPFFFFIRDANGALLFAGQVVDPTAN